MKLVQSKKASLHKILNIISRHFPNTPSEIQREHLEAAITYIKYKTGMPSDELEQLRSTMALAHPIHPRSVFAMELRAERAKGIAIGIAQAEQKAAQLKDELNVLAEQKAAIEKSATIQHMLDEHFDWAMIQKITGVAEADFPALLQKAEGAGKQP